jgi:hypothetical protein
VLELLIDEFITNWGTLPLPIFLLSILYLSTVDQRLHDHLSVFLFSGVLIAIQRIEVSHNDFEVLLVLALVVDVDFVVNHVEQVALKGRELGRWDGHCVLEVAVFVETVLRLVHKSILLVVFRCKGHTSSKETMSERMRLVLYTYLQQLE